MEPSEDLLFRDGLGDRLLTRDAHGRPVNECLFIRPELTSVPAFEFALNERLWLVERFDHPGFLTVRNIVRAPGQLASICLVNDLTGGTRLSDLLARAATGGQPISAGATAFVLQEVLDALSELHRQSGELAHGAVAPERIVLAGGKVRLADYVLAPAIEQLRFSAERYWKELRVAVPSSAGGARTVEHLGAAAHSQLAAASAAYGSAPSVRARRGGVQGFGSGNERERPAACPRRSRFAAPKAVEGCATSRSQGRNKRARHANPS
jgi:serine/threonine protein kinase